MIIWQVYLKKVLDGGRIGCMQYKFHHIGVLCADTQASVAFYRDVLGHQVTDRFYRQDEVDLTFVGNGSDVWVELIGAPFGGGEKTFVAERGYGIQHIAFSVPDVDAAFAQLVADGVRVAWEPEDVLFVRHCGVYDDCGNVIEILQERELLTRPQLGHSVPYQLHHPSIFSDNWQRTQRFYEQHFGFTCVFQYIYDHGGAFIYLADSCFGKGAHDVLIEVIGPPYQEAREFAFAKRFGIGFDHIGYVVRDVETAYRHVANSTVSASLPPYSDYQTMMAWVEDADSIDLELMLPLDNSRLHEALASKVPYRPAN